jgi:two-component system response regulator YesN
VHYCTDLLIKNNLSANEKLKSVVDMQITSLYGNAVQLTTDKTFTAAYQTENPTAFYEIYSRLESIEDGNSFIGAVFYYNKPLKKVYSKNAVFNQENFFAYGAQYSGCTEEHFFSVLDAVGKNNAWIPQQDLMGSDSKDSAFIYIAPINYSSMTTDSLLFYQINSATIDNLLGTGAGRGALVISMSDGDTVFSTDKNLFRPKNTGSLDELLGGRDSAECSWQGRKLLVTCSRSSTTGLSYYSLVPVDLALSGINRLILIFFFGMVVILLLGLAAITFAMRLNYRPINELSKLAHNVLPSDTEIKDDISAASSALRTLSADKQRSEAEHRQYMYEKLLFRLLNGDADSVESFNAQGVYLGVKISGPCFRTVVLKDAAGKSLTPAVTDEAKSIFSADIEALTLSYTDELIIIISEKLSDKHATDIAIIDKLQKIFRNKDGCGLVAGIGGVYGKIKDISQSYFEAKTALKNSMNPESQKIFVFNKYRTDTGRDTYPERELAALKLAIQLSDIDRIELAMNNMLNMIGTADSSALKICIFSDVLNIVSGAVREISPCDLKDKYIGILMSGQGNVNAVQLMKSLQNDFADIYYKTKSPEEIQIKEILSYINDHYMEYEFSISVLADAFKMSASNFSHFFKNRMACTVTDYINNIRIERTKYLLCNSELSVQDISTRVGYLYVSSLLRKFKTVVGMTPGEYRLNVLGQKGASNDGGGADDPG